MLISGWGRLSEEDWSPKPESLLNVAFVPLITSEDCSNRYKKLYDMGEISESHSKVTEDMVCAGFDSGKLGLPMRKTDNSIALMAPPLFKNIVLVLLLLQGLSSELHD